MKLVSTSTWCTVPRGERKRDINNTVDKRGEGLWGRKGQLHEGGGGGMVPPGQQTHPERGPKRSVVFEEHARGCFGPAGPRSHAHGKQREQARENSVGKRVRGIERNTKEACREQTKTTIDSQNGAQQSRLGLNGLHIANQNIPGFIPLLLLLLNLFPGDISRWLGEGGKGKGRRG